MVWKITWGKNGKEPTVVGDARLLRSLNAIYSTALLRLGKKENRLVGLPTHHACDRYDNTGNGQHISFATDDSPLQTDGSDQGKLTLMYSETMLWTLDQDKFRDSYSMQSLNSIAPSPPPPGQTTQRYQNLTTRPRIHTSAKIHDLTHLSMPKPVIGGMGDR